MNQPTKDEINEALGASNADWKEDGEWETSSGQGKSWDFKTQEVVQGVYIGNHPVTTKFGERLIFTLQEQNGDNIDVWETAVLKREFNNTPINTEVRIKYLGKQQNKNGQPVNTFMFQRRKAVK